MKQTLQELREQFDHIAFDEINGEERQQLIREALFRVCSDAIVERYFQTDLSAVVKGEKRVELLFKTQKSGDSMMAERIQSLEGLFTVGDLDDTGLLEVAFDALRQRGDINTLVDLLAYDAVQLDNGEEIVIGKDNDTSRYEQPATINAYAEHMQDLATVFPEHIGRIAERVIYFRETQAATEPRQVIPRENRFHPPIAQA